MNNDNNILNNDYIEIDLKEYLYILWKNKLLIFSVIILSVLIGFFMSEYYIEERFTTQSSIKLGVMENSIYTNKNNVSSIVNNNQFMEKLNEKYKIEESFDQIEINVSSNGSIIEFNLIGNNPKTLKLYADSIAKYYVEISNKDIIEKTNKIREPLSSLIQNISNVNDNLNSLIRKISDLEEIDQININFIQNTLFDIQRTTSDFKYNNIQVFEIITKLSEVQEAELIYLADIPTNSIEPNTKLNVAIAFVLGLFLAVFIIFIKEFFEGTDWNIYKNK